MRTWVFAALLVGCGASTPPTTNTPPVASHPSTTTWDLPPAEADLASRRVRGSRFAHVDAQITGDKSTFQKVAGPFSGQAGERDLPTPHRVSVDKDHCYRAYVQADAAIRALAVVIEDSAGGTVLDTETDIAPSHGAFCVDQSGELTIKIASGLGQGRYAVELWQKK